MTIAETMTQASNEELIEHILTRYHDTHREQLPELIQLSERVERVHGGHTACPAGLSAHLAQMAEELETHMAKEEQILFPMIARGMGAMASGPVSVMRHEHEDHGTALEELERITNGLTLPEGACRSWQRLYQGLESFRDDLKAHIQTENTLLFSRIDGGS
ncbi:hemerythrin domain-containing protein [Marinobacter sp. TBZ242]|uniref:Hemerythrin domain-containing protein n=1 Tax=Marinobacter azerbaijanicus TaxID=3050455 RepID=A0ABT7IB65_9GAMM|nr:hemerythrin domain-containing protein [Marinobacter sp. TBZ242]MDL0431375.1 hemerythrin domain-containing protein [Marinobacter sp. TBZ242]